MTSTSSREPAQYRLCRIETNPPHYYYVVVAGAGFRLFPSLKSSLIPAKSKIGPASFLRGEVEADEPLLTTTRWRSSLAQDVMT
jgi:hypothetical protein